MTLGQSVKSVLRGIVPPLVWDIARQLAHKNRIYRSWEAAAVAAGTYDDLLVNQFRAARHSEVIDLSDNALAWLIEFIPGPSSIVDFGGATGEVGTALLATGADISCTVVENSTLVEQMRGRGGLRFTSDIPPSCDIFFTSGTLQFLPDPYAALEQGFASAKRAVVLKRNNFSEREVFRVHRSALFENGRGAIPPGFENRVISYPTRTVAESRVRQIAELHGFRLVARTHETDGVACPEDGVYGAQLVFLRR